jgi:protoporphyrinogen/coproporphyrinogen III oxidase
VRDLVAGRFGGQIADRLVDPLVGGIHAGSIDSLSAEATVPQLLAPARRSRSLLLGLRRAAAGVPDGPMFATPRDGLAVLVDALVGRLRERSVSFQPIAVTSLTRRRSGWSLEPFDGSFDGVVIATPASTAAGLLGSEAPSGLSAITSASVVLVTFAYSDLGVPPGVNGVLVPRSSGMLATACSFASAKWPHWANPGRTVLRVSAGRAGDDRAMPMSDDELCDRLAGEIGRLTGRHSASPETRRVSRWPDSFPQYRVGHGDLVRSIGEELHSRFPGVEVCGSSYGGAGLPACISSGRQAARRIAARQQEKGAA